MPDITIRTIKPGDNSSIASIIRATLAEFRANKAGTVFFDDSTDHLFELFQRKRSVYYVAEQDNEILGGAGIFPSDGLPGDVCELVKMYLKVKARGLGLGKNLIERCLEFAISQEYKSVYLETMPELSKAVIVYEKMGFRCLEGPMGNTGHFGCQVWMIKQL